jgi:alkanesulfonate monooxygenase SsuD/methylene tetrahydromethanopterin reductase-like flavin-dependent oxidoreductase (luciferase family)
VPDAAGRFLRQLGETVELAQSIEQKLGPRGVSTMWVNDNLGYRSTLVTLAALAERLKVKLGTAILVAYIRNPVDLASSAATVAELTGGREFNLGLGPGSRVLVEDKLEMTKPAKFFGEMVRTVRKLLDGESVSLEEVPTITEYFNLKPSWQAKLKFKPGGKVGIFGSVHQGRETLIREQVARFCDGAILGRVRSVTSYEELKSDADALDGIRRKAGVFSPIRKAIQMTTSIGDDGAAARRLLKGNISHFLDREDAPAKLGFTAEQMKNIREAIEVHGEESLDHLISDAVVDRFFIGGTPRECVDKVARFLDAASRSGFNHVIISGPLGPDVRKSVDAWARDILPSVL